MTILVQHKFRSQKPDGADASVIRPSNWNDAHAITMAGPSLMGRAVGGTGDAQEIILGLGLRFTNNTLNIDNADAKTLNGQDASYYTNIPARLGFTPVISNNPGRLRLEWGQDSEPYMIVDNTAIQLTRRVLYNTLEGRVNDASATANNAFNAIRLAGYGETFDAVVPNGAVMTGLTVNNAKAYRVVQGFSPSRGWINAYNA